MWAVVLGNFGITVFGGQGSLVGVEDIFGFRDVGHLIGEVVRRGMAGLSDFVPEPRTSPAEGRSVVQRAESNSHTEVRPHGS